MIDIVANIADVRKTIQQACDRANRDPDDVTLITVTKEQPLAYILQAIEAGERHFGENRIVEARDKIERLEDEKIDWHMLGDVTHSHIRYIPRLFSTFQALDDMGRAIDLSNFSIKGALKRQSVFVQINISGEATKRGFDAYNWEHDRERFRTIVAKFRDLSKFQGIRVDGLMTLAPYDLDTESLRPFFRSMTRLRDALQDETGMLLPHLSMGMTNDYAVAIEEGATMVRVGRAIFGERD